MSEHPLDSRETQSASDGLLSRAISGDRDALGALLQSLAPALRSQISEQLPRRWQAVLSCDDVLQQTFTDAFLAITRFRPRGPDSLLAWLVTLARRNLHDAIRLLEADKRGGGWEQGGAGGGTSQDRLIERLATSLTSPSGKLMRTEAAAALREALASLPSAHRRVVEAVDLAGRPIQDVAVELERSCGATSMLRARAHRWLAEILGGAPRS